MSNIHALQDEANKHTAKGFDLVGNNTRPWKDENSEQTFTENNELPRAINFVDGTAAAPSSVDGDIYVLTGSGTIHADWGASTFGDWTRAKNTIFTPITPVKGMLCYDDTASTWKEFDGSVWAAFGGGVTNLSEGASTTTTVDVDSDTGTNATLQPASTIRAGVMSKAKFDEVVVNNAKVTNATHTSEVTGATALTVQPIAVSNKTLITATGTMELLVNDAGTLKKVVASDFLGGSNLYTADGALTGARTVTMGGFGLNFEGGVTTFKSAGTTLSFPTLITKNSADELALQVLGDGTTWNGSGSTGLYCTSFGEYSLRSATGAANTAYGYRSQRDMVSGVNNVSGGYASMQAATTASNNIAMGYAVMQLGDGYNYNIGIGDFALKDVTTGGDYNIGIGSIALENLTNGDYNIGLGYRTAQALTTGIENVFLGNLAAYRSYNGSNSIFIGNRAGSWETASNTLIVDTLIRGSEANSRTQAILYGNISSNMKSQVLTVNGVFREQPMTAAVASTITAVDGMQVYVNSTDATFTAVGFWGYENGTWVKL